MIEGLVPYPEYRDSGLPWLPKIPTSWSVLRNGRLFTQRNTTGHSDLPILEVSLRSGVRVRDMEVGSRKQVMSDRSKYKQARAGDLAYNTMRMWQGAVGAVPVDGLVSPAYVVGRPVQDVVAAYFSHLFRTAEYMREIDTFSRGIVRDRNRLYWEAFKQIPTPSPSGEEQRLILRFIAHADRLVRRALHSKRELIARLGEQKQTLLHIAVTRGMDAGVHSKPSGVPWLGNVPAHWEVCRLGQLATSFRTGPFGSILHQSDYVDGGTPIINPTHMSNGRIIEDARCSVSRYAADRLSAYRLDRHDVVFSRRGELGRCALVRDREVGWICGTGSIRVRLAYDGIEPEYLLQALQVRWVAHYLSLSSVGATMDNLNTGILKGLTVLVPPAGEQRDLVRRIAEDALSLDRATAEAHGQIRLLLEYRARLVADLVTGRRDVRAAASRLPDEECTNHMRDDSTMADGDGVATGSGLGEVTEEVSA